MFGIGPLELVVLALVGLIVLGPDRLPGLAKDAARMIRTLRELATGARQQLEDELGPEFGDIDLRNLNPRTALQRAVLGDENPLADLRRIDPRKFDAREQARKMLFGDDADTGDAADNGAAAHGAGGYGTGGDGAVAGANGAVADADGRVIMPVRLDKDGPPLGTPRLTPSGTERPRPRPRPGPGTLPPAGAANPASSGEAGSAAASDGGASAAAADFDDIT